MNTIRSRYELRELLNKYHSHFSIGEETLSFLKDMNTDIMQRFSYDIKEMNIDEIIQSLPYGIENRYYNLDNIKNNKIQYLDLSLKDALDINSLLKDKVLDTRKPSKWNVKLDNAQSLLAYGTELTVKKGCLANFSKLLVMDKIVMQLKNQFLYNLSLQEKINEHKAHIQIGDSFLNYLWNNLKFYEQMQYFEILSQDVEDDELSRKYIINLLNGPNDHTKLKKIYSGDKIFPNLTKRLIKDTNITQDNLKEFDLWDILYCLIFNKMLKSIKIHDPEKDKFIQENEFARASYKETRGVLQDKWKNFYSKYIGDPNDPIKVPQMIRKAIIHSKNILTIYKKTIGIEIIETLISATILKRKTEYSQNMSLNILTLNEDLTFKYHISRKIPDIALKNEGYQFQKIIRSDDHAKDDVETEEKDPHEPIGVSITEAVHSHDFMYSQIHETDLHHGSMGKFSINTTFGYDFFSIFYNILEKSQKNNIPNFGLDDKEILFIKALYGINFDLIDDPVLKQKFLQFALDFKKTKKLECMPEDFQQCNVSKTLLRGIINTVYAKKFEIMEIYFCINIFLSFDSFQMNTFCDLRGRRYPEPSVFNYLNKLACQFFNFSAQYTKIQIGENLEKTKKNIEKHILEQYPKLKDYLSLSSLNDVLQNFDKLDIKLTKVFHSAILLQDLNNINKNKNGIVSYKCESNEGQDACSSGVQVGGMTTESYNLAIAGGLIIEDNKKIPDIYLQAASLINDKYIPGLVQLAKQFKKRNEKLFLDLSANLEMLGDSYNFYYWLNTTKFYTFFEEKRKKFEINSLGIKKDDHHTINKCKRYVFFSQGLIGKIQKKCNFSKDLNHEDRMFFKTIEIFILYFCYNKLKPFNKFFSRSLYKHRCMTHFYGASAYTRQQKMKDAFFKQYLSSTEILPPFKKNLHFPLSILLMAQDGCITNFLRKTYPEAFLLIETIRELSNQKVFSPGIIRTDHVSWEYEPYSVDKTVVKSIFNKNYKVYQYTDETDWQKYASAYLANYIQLCDATLAKIILKLKAKELPNCPLIINHDCFKFPFVFHDQMMDIITRAYQEFTNQKYLHKHLLCDEVFNIVYNRKIKDIPNFRYFRGEDINGVLVKP